LVYADDVNLLGDNKDTIKNIQTLIDLSKVGLEVNTGKTKSHHQISRQNHDINILYNVGGY
jgi:hypothetical protein